MIAGVFIAIAGALFLLDVLAHRSGRPLSLANATVWTMVYIAGALAFAAFLWTQVGSEPASLFLAGFVMEKALSIDNLMVFVAIFAYFKIPAEYQHRILHYGIIGAIVFRLVFVTIGAGGLQLFGAPVALLFGLVVLWSAMKMWGSTGGDEEPVDYAAQWYARWAVALLPFLNEIDGPNFLRTKCRDCGVLKGNINDPYGVRFICSPQWYGTPLLMCLIAIELSDVMFSFDSVPAVIAVTQDPVLVYSAMLFAILGLRMLYFVLSAALRFLTRLGGAVVLVLFFIGIKLTGEALLQLAHRFGFETPGFLHVTPVMSLGVVLTLLAGGVLASILWPATPTEPAPDGPLER